MTIRRALLAAALLLSACTPPTSADDREYRVELGRLTYSGVEAQVQVPAVVRAGEPFTVRAVTWGSTCRLPAPAKVATSPARTDIEVYVREPINGVCNRALGAIEHEVQIVFPQPGTATVAIHGQGWNTGGGLDVIQLVIERTVTVQ
jgi:hypothetical protein